MNNANFAVAIERSNPNIELWEDDTIVGRGDVNGNKRVSKFHCRIFKNSSGKIFVNSFRLVLCLVLLTKLNHDFNKLLNVYHPYFKYPECVIHAHLHLLSVPWKLHM